MASSKRTVSLRLSGYIVLVAMLLVLQRPAWADGSVSGELTAKAVADSPLAPAEARISVTIPIGAPAVSPTEQGQELSLEAYGILRVPGKPALPSKIFAVAIPPGAEPVAVRFDTGEGVAMPGVYQIAPVPLPGVIGEENPAVQAGQQKVYQANYDAVYRVDDPYPQQVVEFVRTAGYREYNLVDVRVTPFSYRPLSGRLTYYPNVTVYVAYRFPPGRAQESVGHLPRTERMAQEIVLNHEQAQAWYPQRGSKDRGVHDYVIITLSSLTAAVEPLVAWETMKGRTVQVVTTTWISSNYSGYDLAAKIRNFLRDKYPADEWGIEDVLLVGHYDDVPMRRTWQDMGYGQPETDFYYAELSLPDEQSWDSDSDHLWGEDSDAVDFYGEVNVGRIPWSGASTVQAICQKSVAYEQNEDPAYKKNILLLGAYFWDDTDNARLMEAKVDQTWMADWTMTRMYEKNSGYWSVFPCDYPLLHSNVMAVWPVETFAFVNWGGHGSPTSAHIYGLGAPAFVQSSDCPQLNDDYPAIVFAASCSNSDTDYLNLGQAMIQRGAVGFLGATKVAFGMHAWDSAYDGTTQSMDYFFTTLVTAGDYSMGAAQQWTLVEMYTHGLWYYDKYETFEWGALWGNPDLGMGPPPFMRVLLPEGWPDYVAPGTENAVTVQIFEGAEDVVPDTALLHYRYHGGAWLTAPLALLEGEFYEATLPPAFCADLAEYYFSAEGTVSGVVTNPEFAPGQRYVARVATLTPVMVDNFQTDQGWTVENDPSVTSGSWQRGVPVGDGDRGDPLTDFDGSGKCYLTGNAPGDSDVDGGPTRLISPVIDLGGASDPVVRYARWWVNDDLDGDPLDVEVSNDDGASWTLVERVRNAPPGWVERSFEITNYVPLTSQMRVRFSVTDNPNNSKDEAGIDAFEIFDVSCADPGTADYDGDEDVDLADFGAFQRCFAGPATGDCGNAFEFVINGSIDLDDLGRFVLRLTPPQE